MLLKSLNFFSLLLQKNNLIDIFIKYFFVAIIAFGVDAGVLSVSVRFLGFSLFLSAALGFLAGVVVNYFLSVRYVFDARRMKNRIGREFAIFFFIGIFGLFIKKCILYYGYVMLAIALGGAAAAVMRNIFASKTSQTIGMELRSDMYRKVQSLAQ